MKSSSKVRVVSIITKLELGGAQKVCLTIFNGLKNLKNIEPWLISGSQGQLVNDLKDKKNICLISSLKREIFFLSIFNEFKVFIELFKKLRELKKENPNILVHTHSTKAGILGRWAAFFAGIKYRVHTVHGFCFNSHQNFVLNFIYFACEWLTALVTTQFICVSKRDMNIGKKFLPFFSKRQTLIRAAVDWQNFTQANYALKASHEDKPFIFGTIACFKPQKNLIDLLKAFAVVHHQNPQTRLEIIGDGEQRNFIEKWIADHRLNNVIKLHGWQKNVVTIMDRWHTFVLSSLWEGLPCAVVEARLLKLPVISYDTGGITEIIFDNINGLIFKQKDWQSLSNGMLKISLDRSLFEKLQNYQDDLSSFKDSTMVELHVQLYENLLNKSRPFNSTPDII